MLITAFARVGLSGDSGLAGRLTRLAGISRARELMSLSERINVYRAEALGLINRVVPCYSACNFGSDSFLMKFAGECGSSTENRRHAERLSNFIASTEWFDGVSDSEDSVILAVRSEAEEAQCPLCATASRRIHGRYIRHVADIPSAGRRVRLRLLRRRFTCEVPHCRRRIFAERFGEDIVPLRRRRTARLEYIVHHLGLALGGRPAASFAKWLMLPVSNDTLLRVVRRRTAMPQIHCLLWASMTGRSGETIDTGRSCAIWSVGGSFTLLPDREPRRRYGYVPHPSRHT